ncbi:hypothetical protein E2562_037803 [Oryza meyeriana var. granulata]|uniref:Uncharacterized protein n=1 Tax=Oryza meyeriana var. granulata TaxID=110450 RepID=A0A6G1DTC8_9ORYZ|nr:hypothetical protein E2562_037803 [Oryza meyeriana var. granulata]
MQQARQLSGGLVRRRRTATPSKIEVATAWWCGPAATPGSATTKIGMAGESLLEYLIVVYVTGAPFALVQVDSY